MKLRDLFSDDAAIEPQAEAVDVKGLSVDSRAVKPGDLFFAIAGSKTDGSRFVDSAILAGGGAGAGGPAAPRRPPAALFVSSHSRPAPAPAAGPIFSRPPPATEAAA